MKLCADLSLPSDAATQTYGIVGRRGSGKSYLAGKLVELLLEAKKQVVVVDPVGIWYGLRLLPDGEDSQFKIPILGGQRQDIPLEPSSGKLIADVVVDHAGSMVLDVSEMTGGEQRHFVADFETQLFQRKKKARSPLLLVFDEAQEFFPQHVFRGDEWSARMLGAGERLVKIGRNFGIGIALITQRPQAVSKEVLNLTEVLVIFQTTGPQERKTIEGWVQEHGFDDRDVKDRLPGLAVGEALLWSPQWLKTFRQVKALPKKTFDASATPTEVEQTIVPKPIDLSALQKKMAATIERAKADDPKELKKQIKQLTQELLAASDRKNIVIDESAVEKAVVAERQVWRHLFDKVSRELTSTVETLGGMDLVEPTDWRSNLKLKPARVAQKVEQHTRNVRVARSIRAASSNGTSDTIPAGERKILSVLAQYGTTVSISFLMIWCDMAERTIQNYLSSLRGKELVQGTGSAIEITDQGMNMIAPHIEPLPTGDALREHYRQTLPGGESRVLGVVCEGMSAIGTICEATGMAERTVQNYVSALRSRRLVSGSGQNIRPSPELFG